METDEALDGTWNTALLVFEFICFLSCGFPPKELPGHLGQRFAVPGDLYGLLAGAGHRLERRGPGDERFRQF